MQLYKSHGHDDNLNRFSVPIRIYKKSESSNFVVRPGLRLLGERTDKNKMDGS